MPRKKKHGGARLEDARARMYHDLIFESAEYVFGAKGFESATMQDIAREAGVSLKTLYATFPGKQELYDEVQRERGTGLVAEVNQCLAEGGDALTRLRAVVRTNVEYLFEHKDWFQIHLQDRVPWALKPKALHAVAYWEQGVGAIVAVLEEGARQGVFRDDDPWSLAMMMQSIVQVQVARAVERDERDVERIVADVEGPVLRVVCREVPEDIQASA